MCEAVAEIIGIPEAEIPNRMEEIKTARARLKLSKTLVECKEYQQIKKFQADFIQGIKAQYVMPSFIDEGLYAVRSNLCEEVDKQVKAAQAKLSTELVPAFIKVYLDKIEESVRDLKTQFRPQDYPEPNQMASKFGITHRFVQFGIPDGLPEELAKEQEEKMRKMYAEAEEQMSLAIAVEFKKLIDHIVDRLGDGEEEGSRKRFNSSLFDNLTQFMDGFKNRNILNNTELEKLVEQAKGIVQSTPGLDNKDRVEKIRDFNQLRADTRKAFDMVREAVDKTIEEIPSRTFDFSMDEPEGTAA